MMRKIKRDISKVCFVMLLMSGAVAVAQTPAKVSYSVDPDKVVNPIDVGIHGQFLEHIFNSVHGGLWGDMVRNPSLEATGGGGWVIEENTVKSTGRITDQRLVFGDETWGDYDVQLEARKLDGAEGFIVLFRVAGEGRFYWANMGGWQNREHGFEKARRPFGKHVAGVIEKERWYRVRVRCEGPRYQVWLDDQLVLDAVDTKEPILHGAIGLSGWDSHVQFRNIKVTSLDGKTLFEGVPPRTALAVAPAYWKMFGSADFIADNREPFNGHTSLRIKRQGEEGEAGLRQKPMLIRGGERYQGSLWMKGTATRKVQVRLMGEEGQLVFRQELSNVGPEWKKQTFAFTAAHTVSNAVFELAFAGAGDVSVDMISLFSQSALEAGGFRPDLLQAIAEQKPATIRYPGGCFASGYRWKDGIGPREKRVYFPNVIWADQDPNQMGTDEFMLLCEKVGAEPIIPINMALGEQEALEWMEYCNGDASTGWGKVRAANGHPKPYNVKYWEIDNETWGMGPEKYAEVVTKFSKALRAKDPSVKIIACGSYGYDDGKGSSNGWNKRLLAAAAKDFDYLSIHYYNGICYAQDYVDDPRRFEAFMKDEVAGLIKASANPSILIYCSEWGMMNASWKSGLYTGGILNAFERAGEFVPMACPAVWLQTAPAAGEPRWASCSILFDHRTWYPAPTYVVQKMWRDNFAPNRLAMEGPEKPLNAVATKSADGKTFYFKAVNVSKEAVDVVLTLAGKAKVDSAEYQLAAPSDENARNSLETPHKIWPKAAEVKVDGQTVLFAMPPLSAGVVKMNIANTSPPPPMLPGDRIDIPGNFNPLLPGYFADPTIKKFGDIYYIYATTDGNNGGRGPATVWVSRNFVDWYCVPMNWPQTAFYWAPDVIARDGKYYLYYSQPCQIFGGEGASPIGPWKALKEGDNVLIPDRFIKEAITLDFQAFEDKDGKTYSFFGTWGIFANSGCGVALLNPDMRTFNKLGLIPNTQAKAFFEAPFMLERDGIYYFMYSSDSCHTETYKVQYATSDKPFGNPFVFGKNNPILQSSADLTIDGPGHHSMLKEGDEYYMIYHLHDIPRTPNGMHRQVCADKMVFGTEKGVIEQITPTHKGIGMLGSSAPREKNLLFCKPVTASSFYTDVTRKHPYDKTENNTYKPSYAVDDNNATLWRPASNKMESEWLVVDLEKSEKIRRVETQFEYATWYYQYTIEYSMDGMEWKMFADRSANYRWGSPMIDLREEAIKARYLRLRILNTEWPGFSGAVWNIKAFADAPINPLADMADKAFADFIVPTYKDGKPGQTAQGFQGAPYVKPGGLLVDISADAFAVGASVGEWTNKGKAGGSFKAEANSQPTVEMAAGCKAVKFDGQQWLKATFTAPRSLAGSSSFTAAAWVCNPEFADVECVLRWGGRGGPEGNMSQLNYGANDRVGAVGHAGFPDMGFGSSKPQAGVWNHIAAVYDGVVEKIYVNGKLANASPKMLLVTQDQPLFVGASDVGAEPLSGYISSVQLYDTPLDAEAIARLAAEKPKAEVACNVNAAKLSAGTIESWKSDGYLGGALKGKEGRPLEVAIINGRMAVRYCTANLEKEMPELATISDSTKVYSINLGKSETAPWFLCIASAGAPLRLYDLQGAVSEEQAKTDSEAKSVLDAQGKGDTAWYSELSFFNRKLTDAEMAAVYAGWKSRWTRPEPPTFAEAPRAVLPSLVVMRAEQGRSPYGAVEYLFEETTGAVVGKPGGWSQQQDFLCNGMESNKKYAFAIRLRDKYGNVSERSKPAAVSTAIGSRNTFTMNVSQDRDFLKDGVQGTQWDGMLADPARNPEVLAIKDNTLRLQSKNTKWDGDAPNGVFIYKNIQGDFIAIAEVAAYPGWRGNGNILGNNDAGLMVRVPDLEDAGKGEDLVQLDMFLAWGVGNLWTSFDANHGRPQEGNRTGNNAHGFLMIERRGEKFYMRTSPDGKNWADMPRSPIVRADIGNLSTLQVGFAHASYGDQSSWIEFKSLEISTSEKMK